MKKLLALLPLIGAFALAGCGGEKEEENSGGDHLDYNEEQVKQKVRTLGETSGYEISFVVKSSDSEDDSYTIGAKNHFYWGYNDDSKSMYHLENDMVQTYRYDSESGMFEKYGEEYSIAGTDYEENFRVGYDLYLCMGSTHAESGGLTKVKETTFLGRQATEYKLSYGSVYGSASYELIVDKETGITLKWAVSGTSYVDGESGAASFEVTSFKTGDDVVVPSIKAEA